MQFSMFSGVLETALLILLACFQQSASRLTKQKSIPQFDKDKDALYAVCKMTPSTTLAKGLPEIRGKLLFKQENPQEPLKVLFLLSGFPTEGSPQPRAVHIHQYGDLSGGCESTGGHYNPLAVNHPNHPGDFGSLIPEIGRIHTLINSYATLFGELSVFGRAVVVHEKQDDLGLGGDPGSLLHGNAGRRLACCVIGRSKKF